MMSEQFLDWFFTEVKKESIFSSNFKDWIFIGVTFFSRN